MIIDPNYEDFIQQDQINEMFALPIGLKPVVRIDGKEFYGSDKLNASFIKALAKTSRTKPSLEKLSQLVSKKKIIPAFFSKGFGSFVSWKIFAPSHVKGIMGFYAPKSKQIYLMISNNSNIFGFSSNNFLSLLTIHESMHMAADENPSKFFTLFKQELLQYYGVLWGIYFVVKDRFWIDQEKRNLPLKKIEDVVTFVFNEIERKPVNDTKLIKIHNMLLEIYKPLTTLDDETFKRRLIDYVVLPKIFLKDRKKFFSVYRKYTALNHALYRAYFRAFDMKNLTTLCIQELIYPSEVIAIFSEETSSGKIKSAVNML